MPMLAVFKAPYCARFRTREVERLVGVVVPIEVAHTGFGVGVVAVRLGAHLEPRTRFLKARPSS